MNSFLDELVPVRARISLPAGFTSRGVHLGQGTLALEILVVDAGIDIKASVLREVWKDRLGGRAVPLLAIVLHREIAWICGPAGEDPPVRRIENEASGEPLPARHRRTRPKCRPEISARCSTRPRVGATRG